MLGFAKNESLIPRKEVALLSMTVSSELSTEGNIEAEKFGKTPRITKFLETSHINESCVVRARRCQRRYFGPTREKRAKLSQRAHLRRWAEVSKLILGA